MDDLWANMAAAANHLSRGNIYEIYWIRQITTIVVVVVLGNENNFFQYQIECLPPVGHAVGVRVFVYLYYVTYKRGPYIVNNAYSTRWLRPSWPP